MANHVSSTDELLVEVKDHVMWLTLNRQAALNSVSPAMLAALHKALNAAEANASTRAVVLTGAGEAFCSGADLGLIAGDDTANHERRVEQFVGDVNDLLNRVEKLPLPVIAALNGVTLGAGLELALCADLIVASSGARIGDGHARYGLLPGGGASARLPRRIGTAAAKWLSFTGDLIVAEQLLACGLVQCVFPAGEFVESVNRLSARIASRSPLGLKRVKALIDNALLITLEEALRDERQMLNLHRSSWDRAEGLKAFAEKRTPSFRGV
jgi:enoyl-CoA hydratase/carnithine racemase